MKKALKSTANKLKKKSVLRHVYVRDENRNPIGLVTYKEVKSAGEKYIRFTWSVVHPSDQTKFSQYAKEINQKRWKAGKSLDIDYKTENNIQPLAVIYRYLSSERSAGYKVTDKMRFPRRLLDWGDARWREYLALNRMRTPNCGRVAKVALIQKENKED